MTERAIVKTVAAVLVVSILCVAALKLSRSPAGNPLSYVNTANAASETASTNRDKPPTQVEAAPAATRPNPPQQEQAMTETARIIIETTEGPITVILDGTKAPLTVDNFLRYVKDNFYAGTVFHRVIDGFMVQGGGMDANLTQKPNYPPIKNEATNGLKNKRGTLAMARTGVVDSATSQFFINLVDNEFLDNKGTNPAQYGYAVFGKVIAGMEVVDRIAKTKTGMKNGMQDVPLQPITIMKTVVLTGQVDASQASEAIPAVQDATSDLPQETTGLNVDSTEAILNKEE